MPWNLVDQVLLMVTLIILLAVTDTILKVLNKDQFSRWINFLGVVIILGIVINEIVQFVNHLRRMLQRLW